MVFSRQKKGQIAERYARRYLKSQGLRYIESNFSSRFGEIDLIFKDESQWVFVEVRSRADSRFMHPAESINKAKQRRLALTAEFYLQKNASHSADSARFDVVTIEKNQCQWIRNAFFTAVM